MEKITVVGGGLAGCEAAWQIAQGGVPVELFEMKPQKFSPAHKSQGLAELICSNSLKAARIESAAGLLKEEMRRLGSLLVPIAERTAVPAGGALAVDREEFSRLATEAIEGHPLISLRREELSELPEGVAVVATGPLTAEPLAEKVRELCGGGLYFFDAAAPIVTAESVDMDRCFAADRYGRGEGTGDYINCPMNKEEYERFAAALVDAERAPLHGVDRDGPKVYEGCMPIEVLAGRGLDAMRYGPMKPVGLTDPRTGHRPWAVVQLRTENRERTLYNLVGFQTNLKFGEQRRVFGMIPGLERAEFVRYGVMHRNTFLDSPRLLRGDFSLRQRSGLFFAGQMTGVEGYMESAASGILAGLNALRKLRDREPLILPETTMMGALSRYMSGYEGKDFQPMGANFGILPPLSEKIRDKRQRYARLAQRALEDLEERRKTCGLL
ncbi:methylenetetrahydrofolate--tRNA-(uracil(54)-C(5))-methyltransferase (FADH(2)-oxidizing) TrmFO [Acutalibacter sp. 1XD8-33]|uniref:methylenetetrahydrofolate--tRNA-(uracil(54)- C(5))-methyltransferase (FADH(2)-oxidizing) TrmFO n=1 Tax=Acutalibacter sp. 1XD8-33 TaxID=2320081 RepID=UPI000EA04BED|nr:methylenetetrahydrofolate--tRNA-(uracil(54)-C(5))-methyltransferase (FADH(2)-oxidizing) TrmFO [Acutalibacter sp. 1XD8-33]RKJ40997.1 methylenetetrahydrofolate--tRNA-(uracil(54)-C(5))-methyltransferase (FADH(2)-oxidizing) TrmFO [Acutalibacter sp. 1XD8-33]